MYRTFYGLNAAPFSPQPDIRFLFLNENRRRALGLAGYVVRERTGFCLITGKAGIGKTILLQALIKRMEKHAHAGLVTCVPESTQSFTGLIATAFGIETADATTGETYRRIKDYIASLGLTGKCALLIIDNAHILKPAAFKLLVHLASIDKTLQVILVGYPELRQQFCRPVLGESAPQVIVQSDLHEFNMSETDAYIRHRIARAGGPADIFSQSDSETVYRFSQGVPGLINCACNYALEAGYEGKHRIIDKSIIADLLEDADDSGALDTAGELQQVTAVPELPDEPAGIKPAPETGAGDAADISGYLRQSLENQRRQNRRLAYASLAGILLPATAVVWLFFQLRPGENLDPAGDTQIARNAQPVTEQFVSETTQSTMTSAPPLVSLPAESELTEDTDKLAKINALNELKARQSRLESHMTEQRVETTRLKEAMQREQERITEARSLLSEAPEAAPLIAAEAPAAQDARVYTTSAGQVLLDESEKLAMIEELKEKQQVLERRIAVQRIEYNRIKDELKNENERIIKAKALIKRAYKAARLIWDQFNNVTPMPYPEDPGQS